MMNYNEYPKGITTALQLFTENVRPLAFSTLIEFASCLSSELPPQGEAVFLTLEDFRKLCVLPDVKNFYDPCRDDPSAEGLVGFIWARAVYIIHTEQSEIRTARRN